MTDGIDLEKAKRTKIVISEAWPGPLAGLQTLLAQMLECFCQPCITPKNALLERLSRLSDSSCAARVNMRARATSLSPCHKSGGCQ